MNEFRLFEVADTLLAQTKLFSPRNDHSISKRLLASSFALWIIIANYTDNYGAITGNLRDVTQLHLNHLSHSPPATTQL